MGEKLIYRFRMPDLNEFRIPNIKKWESLYTKTRAISMQKALANIISRHLSIKDYDDKREYRSMFGETLNALEGYFLSHKNDITTEKTYIKKNHEFKPAEKKCQETLFNTYPYYSETSAKSRKR